MKPQYAAAYVDDLFARRDLAGIETLITIRMRSRPISDEGPLFRYTRGWVGAAYNGIWQYYENIRDHEADEIGRLFARFHLPIVKTKFDEGLRLRPRIQDDTSVYRDLDKWIVENENAIEAAAYDAVVKIQDELKQNDN